MRKVSRERWLALDPLVRRAVKTGFWLIVGIILVAIGGVWNLTVLAAAAIFLFPRFGQYTRFNKARRSMGINM